MGASQDDMQALRAQADRDNDDHITDKACNEIKNSVIFQYSPRDLLESTTVAISANGACYAASSSDAAQRVRFNLSRPKYLNDASLAVSLVECGDKGRVAVLQAESELMFVKMASSRAQAKLDDVIEVLQEPQEAKRFLKSQMNDLRRSASDCFEKVTTINNKFDDWLVFTNELYATCIETESDEPEKLRAKELGLAAEQSRFNPQQSTDAKALFEKLGKQLDIFAGSFRNASNDFPQGLNIAGQQIVGGIAESATSALSSFYLSNVYPAPASVQPILSPLTQDPAYGAVQKDMLYLELLKSILINGDGKGVDWDVAVDERGSERTCIKFLEEILADAAKAFNGQATSDIPSATLQKILSESAAIAQAVSQAATGSRPSADSTTVKDWQQRFQEQYVTAVRLSSTARSLPGTSTQGIPLMAQRPDSDPVANAKPTLISAIAGGARNRLILAQEASTKTEEVIRKSFDLLNEQETKLSEINATLQRLSEKQMGIIEIKAVLESSIKLIINVKRNVINLCTSFQSMSLTIEAMDQYIVRKFLGGGDDLDTCKIGNYSLSDYYSTLISHSAITLRAQFSVFADFAGTWGQLSREFVMPGLMMLDKMSDAGPDPDMSRRFLSELQGWSNQALAGVKRPIEGKENRILEDLNDRGEELRRVTRQLQVSEAVRKAITEGTDIAKKATEEMVVQNMKSRPIFN